jgi:arylsulfatase A-like enzyme
LSACSEFNHRQERPNILLIVVDTLRRDHLQLYGYNRRTSDNLDALAAEGWTFDNHLASASQTVPSTLTLMLSQTPAEHGIFHEEEGHFARNRPQFSDNFLFLAEALSGADYSTAALVANPFLQRENGFSQGFEYFLDARGKRAHTLNAAALEWLFEHQKSDQRPFFLYLHYMDVHWPYDPPLETRRFSPRITGKPIYRNGPYPDANPEDLATTIALYDGAISYIDEQVGELARILDRRGQLANTILILTSDHGDEFLEHGGLGHGTTVYGELVRVPLIIRFPNQLEPGRRIPHLTQHLDLAPTILSLAGVPRPPQFSGGTLFQPATRVFAENGRWRTVYSGQFNLVLNPSEGVSNLYHLQDQLDQKPLDNEEVKQQLSRALDWYERQRSPARPNLQVEEDSVDWSSDQIDSLKALGYVQ